MAAIPEADFLSLLESDISLSDESRPTTGTSGRAHLHTLFSEFDRSRPRLSLTRPQTRPPTAVGAVLGDSLPGEEHEAVAGLHGVRPTDETFDLRSLEYVAEYDSMWLMCPICHIPFIDPIVLDCDHTFCSSCYEDYRSSGTNIERSQCPSCRSYTLAFTRKASRLISNMCNDIIVRCPNDGCEVSVPRSSIERHATVDCEELLVACPSSDCAEKIRRRSLVLGQCSHSEKNDGRINNAPTVDVEPPPTCPGFEFGCDEQLQSATVDHHVKHCLLAKSAPYMKKQAQLLSGVREQLAGVRLRNEVLEAGFERINEILRHQVLPKLDDDIEEIHRTPSPSTARDLVLPAHLRALTPSPDHASQQHLLAMHDSLRGNVTTLEMDMNHFANSLAELDARTSMQIMNETLRLKEDLAHTNAALFSTRAQVQWLLNRERAGQHMNMRGRTPASASSSSATTMAPPTTTATSATDVLGGSSSTGPSPTHTPSFGPVRRSSGGSQERVKL